MDKTALNRLTDKIIGASIEIHRALGPGLLESAYERCLCHELALQNLDYACQVSCPVSYKGIRLDCGYRLDLVVEQLVIVELKALESVLPVHHAQLLESQFSATGFVALRTEKLKILRASVSPRPGKCCGFLMGR